MMCMKIKTFRVSVIASNATMVVYGILFGGMHPVGGIACTVMCDILLEDLASNDPHWCIHSFVCSITISH